VYLVIFPDSPGVPPSATAHELFRGFSYIAPMLMEEKEVPRSNLNVNDSLTKVHVRPSIHPSVCLSVCVCVCVC